LCDGGCSRNYAKSYPNQRWKVAPQGASSPNELYSVYQLAMFAPLIETRLSSAHMT
jgi:hypothetical protein